MIKHVRRLAGAEIVRFAVVSGFTTALDYAILGTLAKVLPHKAVFTMVAVAAGYLVGTIVHFVLSRRFVFKPSSFATHVEFSLVIAVSVVGLVLTEVITLFLHAKFGWDLYMAKTVSVVIVFFWNYLARRHVVYREIV